MGASQDEAGTAVYKTIELDTYLKDVPVQHREVQGHESPLFLSNFPNGIRILEGGVASGFHHVSPTEYKVATPLAPWKPLFTAIHTLLCLYQPRLLHLKGRRHVRAQQVPLSRDSLNSGDVFILGTSVSPPQTRVLDGADAGRGSR
jgi:gelsolin